MFSSAPVVQLNIPPTVFPTRSMFNIITASPTARSTPQPNNILIISATQQASSQPTSAQPTSVQPTSVQPTSVQPTSVQPTRLPSPVPTSQQPTHNPTLSPISTASPTQFNVGLSSKTAASNNQTSTDNIGIIVGCVSIILLIIGAFMCFMNRKTTDKKTPYEIWTTHYKNNKEIPLQESHNEDIHHFYHKSPRLSINPNTTFTPHISTRPSNSIRLGPQRNSQINNY
jgi:hypothetical protein